MTTRQSPAQIPRDAIRLSEAYEQYLKARHPEALSARLLWLEAGRTLLAAETRVAADRERDVRLAYSPLAAKAEQEFRDAIIKGMIRPYIRDPSTGDILSLPIDEWQGSNAVEGFHSDYVGSECNNSHPALLQVPGPDTRIGGIGPPQALFFITSEFQRWLDGVGPARKDGSRGAPKVTAVVMACEALWPTGLPPQLQFTERNKRISEWCKQNAGPNGLSDNTILRGVKRFKQQIAANAK